MAPFDLTRFECACRDQTTQHVSTSNNETYPTTTPDPSQPTSTPPLRPQDNPTLNAHTKIQHTRSFLDSPLAGDTQYRKLRTSLQHGAVIYLSLIFEGAGTPRLRAERLNSRVYMYNKKEPSGCLRVPTRAACAKPVSKQQTHNDCKRLVLRARNLKNDLTLERAFLQKNTGRLRVSEVRPGRICRVRTLGRATTGTGKGWLGAPRVQWSSANLFNARDIQDIFGDDESNALDCCLPWYLGQCTHVPLEVEKPSPSHRF